MFCHSMFRHRPVQISSTTVNDPNVWNNSSRTVLKQYFTCHNFYNNCSSRKSFPPFYHPDMTVIHPLAQLKTYCTVILILIKRQLFILRSRSKITLPSKTSSLSAALNDRKIISQKLPKQLQLVQNRKNNYTQINYHTNQ